MIYRFADTSPHQPYSPNGSRLMTARMQAAMEDQSRVDAKYHDLASPRVEVGSDWESWSANRHAIRSNQSALIQGAAV